MALVLSSVGAHNPSNICWVGNINPLPKPSHNCKIVNKRCVNVWWAIKICEREEWQITINHLLRARYKELIPIELNYFFYFNLMMYALISQLQIQFWKQKFRIDTLLLRSTCNNNLKILILSSLMASLLRKFKPANLKPVFNYRGRICEILQNCII